VQHQGVLDVGGSLGLDQRPESACNRRFQPHRLPGPGGAENLDSAQRGELQARQEGMTGSFCANTPASCAAASISSTPGKIGSPADGRAGNTRRREPILADQLLAGTRLVSLVRQADSASIGSRRRVLPARHLPASDLPRRAAD